MHNISVKCPMIGRIHPNIGLSSGSCMPGYIEVANFLVKKIDKKPACLFYFLLLEVITCGCATSDC